MYKTYLFLGCLILLASGCGGVRGHSGTSENVGVYASYATQNCTFLGNISNRSAHENADLKTSLKDLSDDDNHFLKNAGAKLGANVVVFSSHGSSKYTDRYLPSSYTGSGRGKETAIYTHSISGKAYNCPSAKPTANHLSISQTPLFKNDDMKIR